MLFKFEAGYSRIQPVPFHELSALSGREKDLEILIAQNLFGTLFEGSQLMPVFQERPLQSEADIYALDAQGDLFVFELKLGLAGRSALEQLFRYATDAATWTYEDLNRRFAKYCGQRSLPRQELADAHKENFALDAQLGPEQFNRALHMRVIGTAADDQLIRAVEYWGSRGLSIDFSPYRIYKIGEQHYLEFFARPNDHHANPRDIKGVIFDSNRSFDEDPSRCASLRLMVEKRRVSAFGTRKDEVYKLNPKDIVFFSHRWVGIVAAAEVTGPVKRDEDEELFHDVRFLTRTPERFDQDPPAMRFAQVQQITGKTFFWARIAKVPYLNREESLRLVDELKKLLGDPQ